MPRRQRLGKKTCQAMKVAGGPRNGVSVGEIRVTLGHYADGGAFRRADLWKNLEDAHDLRPKPWTGRIIFLTTAEFNGGLSDHLCGAASEWGSPGSQQRRGLAELGVLSAPSRGEAWRSEELGFYWA